MTGLFPTPVEQIADDFVVGSHFCKINISGYSLDNFKTFNPEGYTVLCRFAESYNSALYFPRSAKIVVDFTNYSQMLHTYQNLIPNVAKDLAISEVEATRTIVNFFDDKNIVVQPVGIQGKVYNLMRSVQNYYPMVSMTKAVTTAKTLGLTGSKIITSAPLTFVGATYVGSIFFSYLGTIAGNGTVGVVLNSTSYVLACPMKGVEVVVNGLILRPVSKITGLPLILNGTAEITRGIGIDIQEYSKILLAFERISNSRIGKKVKKIYKTLRE